MRARKILNALLGLAAGIVTAPLVPNETEGYDL